ncbi:MAG: hypothetical protein ACD_20C00350G0028 [uncultured bacterium]|nr:MAG: hypothetical protein ACD_20C00350G0028 [uncultured bacterium]HBH18480.1 hypothetical protein [Cyanobacteria bacterium UBA9579]
MRVDSSLYKAILIFLLIVGQLQVTSLAEELKVSKVKNSNIIEIKDIKGGVQKIETIDKPLPGSISALDESKVLKGKIENQAEFHVLNEIQLNINDVTGPGKASSSLSDGVKYLENINFYGKGNANKLDYNFNLGGRFTNDDMVDNRSMSFTTLQGRLKYKDHILNAGDVFESFSQYSLSSSLKGTSYKFNNSADNLPDVTLVYGYAYPRWESFVRLADTRAVQRMGYGVNVRHDITPTLTTGLSFLRTQDAERQYSSERLYDNNIYSMDYEYKPIPGLTVRGESAFSHADQDPEEGLKNFSYFGHAHRIEAIGDGGPSRVNLEYERVSPKFETLLGAASQDRQKARAKWRYKYNKNITFNSGLLWYMNNLSNADRSVQSYRPEFDVNIRRLFNRRYSQANVSLKFDKKSGYGSRNFDYFTNFNYRDRFGFLETDNSFGFTSFNTNKNRREAYDYNYRTSLGSRHSLGMFVIKPSVNAGTNFIDDEITNKIDKIVEYSAGLGLDIPKHKITSNFRFGQNLLDSGTGDNSNKIFSSISLYYKPSFLGMFNSSTIYVRASVNDFNFQTRTRNFAEKSISMGLNIPVDLFIGKKKVDRI